MVSALDVPAELLVERISTKLKTQGNIKPPVWSTYVKTGAFAERKPQNPDWWFIRCASIMRRLYIEGNVGVGRLRTWYGGRNNSGTHVEHHGDAGGNIIRKAMQQLESAGFIKKEKAGRILTSAGRSLLEKTAMEITRENPVQKPTIKKTEFPKKEKREGESGRRKPRTDAGAPKKARGKKATGREKSSSAKAA
jgi:small subunit ribosomal protein S19e